MHVGTHYESSRAIFVGVFLCPSAREGLTMGSCENRQMLCKIETFAYLTHWNNFGLNLELDCIQFLGFLINFLKDSASAKYIMAVLELQFSKCIYAI